jgi:site-specific recombinase XerD
VAGIMTAALSGELLPAAGAGELEALLREWLIGYQSANTREVYSGDMAHWLRFLAASGVDPLIEARRVHTHAWLRAQETAGAATAIRARCLAAVSAFYAWLIAEDETDRANPAAIDRGSGCRRLYPATTMTWASKVLHLQPENPRLVARLKTYRNLNTSPAVGRQSACLHRLMLDSEDADGSALC